MQSKKKFNLSGPVAFLIAVLVLLIFVPINMIMGYSDKVFDMTPSGRYTLSEKTVQLLEDSADKQIEVYFLSDIENLLDVNAPEFLPLYHTLTELEKRPNITLTCFDPDEDKELAESLNPSGAIEVGTGDVFVKCGDVIKKVDASKIFQADSQNNASYAGEELIASAIYACAVGKLPTVYFISGYSEKTLADNYSVYADEIKADNYDVKELDLSSVDSVPDDANIVYLAGVDRDISDEDRDKLSEYADNGGSLSILIPPCDKKGRFENIEYILEKFELSMDYNIISESNTQNQLLDNDSKQNDRFFRVSYPAFSEDYTVDLTTDINTLVANGTYSAGVSNIRSLHESGVDSGMIEKASIIENLPASADSYEYTTISTPMGGDDETAEEAEALTEQPICMGYYSYNKQTGAKLYVIGTDSAIDNDEVSFYTYGTRMMTLFSNTWLYDSDIDMGIGNKANSYDTMHFESSEKATSVLRIFTIIPIAVAIVGVAVWLKRRYA